MVRCMRGSALGRHASEPEVCPCAIERARCWNPCATSRSMLFCLALTDVVKFFTKLLHSLAQTVVNILFEGADETNGSPRNVDPELCYSKNRFDNFFVNSSAVCPEKPVGHCFGQFGASRAFRGTLTAANHRGTPGASPGRSPGISRDIQGEHARLVRSSTSLENLLHAESCGATAGGLGCDPRECPDHLQQSVCPRRLCYGSNISAHLGREGEPPQVVPCCRSAARTSTACWDL